MGCIKIISGDILSCDSSIIVQQVNCKGVMGGGLAKQIIKKYPEVLKEYREYWEDEMIAHYFTDDLLGRVLYVKTHDNKIIANIFGQDDIRKDYKDGTVYTQEWALLRGVKEVKSKAEDLGLSVAIPTYIGCGLANGNWSSIKPKIEEVFEGSKLDVAFYHYR